MRRLMEEQAAAFENERQRLAADQEARVSTARSAAAEDMRHQLEQQWTSERDRIVREERQRVETELGGAFSQERSALRKDLLRLEDEIHRLEQARVTSQMEEKEALQHAENQLTVRLEAERRAAEEQAHRTIEAEKLRMQEDQEARLREASARISAEFDQHLEEERQWFEERRRQDQYDDLEARRQAEEALRQQMEDTLLAQLELERERLTREFENRLAGERSHLEADLRTSLQEDAQRRLREEEERRNRQETELARLRDEEQARSYEDAVRAAIEEGRRTAKDKKIRSYVDQARARLAETRFDEALGELTRVFRLDPGNAEARELEQTVYAARGDRQRQKGELRHLQEEHRRQLEAIQRRVQEQAQRDREQLDQRAIREKKIAERLARGGDYYRQGVYDKAMSEIETIYALDPGNTEAQELEVAILSLQKSRGDVQAMSARRAQQREQWHQEQAERERSREESNDQLKRDSKQVYLAMLQRAWMQGEPSKESLAMLAVSRSTLDITAEEHEQLELQARREAYREMLELHLASGSLSLADTAQCEEYRVRYSIPTDVHLEVLELLRRKGH
jgi:hypothetical protein